MLRTLYLTFAALGTAVCLLALAARLLGLERRVPDPLGRALCKPLGLRGEAFTRSDGLRAAAWGAGMLCLAYGASVLYCGIFDDGVTWANFCDAWQQYDAYHYLHLAQDGYRNYTENGKPLFVVFFPLYPWLMRLFHLVIPSWAVCGHLVSSLCYVGSCVMLARLATEEFGRRVGALSVAFLTLYPFSFFFASLHTESLFLLLSLSSFYCIRRHRWAPAGVLGALAALTRMQGVLLAAVAFAEYCLTERPLQKLRDGQWGALWRDVWGKLFWMAFMGLGTLMYLGLNWFVTGNPFQFTIYQRERWYQGFALFTNSLAKLWNGFLSPSEGYEFAAWTTWGPQLALFVFCLIFLFYGVRRLPPVWTLYYVICIYLNYSLNNPLSCCRYIACAFPLPVLLAIAGQRRPQAARFLLAAFGVLQGIFLLAYFAEKHVC